MPAVKRRYYLLIFVLVLILFGLSARLHLAELLITAPMEQAGLEDVTAEMQQLALNKTHLSQLSFVLLTEAGRLTVDAQDIAINYLPGKLIKGRIDTLEINQLVLNYQLNAKPAEGPGEAQQTLAALQPTEVLAVLRTALAEYILFNELTIHRITLNGEAFAEIDGNSLRLTSTNEAGAIYAELTLLAQSAESPVETTAQAPATDLSQIVITRLSKDELSAELRPAQVTGILPASIRLKLNQTDISGSYQLSPQGMQLWLQPLVNINHTEGLDTINGNLWFNFENEDLLHVRLTTSSKRLSFAPYSAENIALDLRVDYSPHASAHDLKLLDGSYLIADKVSTSVTSFTDSRIKLAGELSAMTDGWQYKGTLNSTLLTTVYQTLQLKLSDVSAVITADAENLQAEGSFSPATLPGQFVFVLAHKLSSGAGSLSLVPTAAIDLTAEDDNISKLLMPWPYPLDLYTGNIELRTAASWSKDKETRLATDISFDNTGGNVGAIVFSGLSFDHELEILPALKSVKASEFKLATVDSGVTVSNISMSLAATTSKRGPLPRMIVRASQGEILGGSFSGEDMVYDLNRDTNSFLINLRDIDLAEIVKTQQLEGITASGRLDGTLPVEINKQGIVISHGGLVNNIRGGTIRYTPETGTEQLRRNPLTGITLDALRDFRYSDLQADVNYQPDGELTINLELKGISPELDENRPVHLNINTEQNLVSLLKSLRFAQGVSDSIDDQVRRMYEQTHNEN